VSSFGGEVPSGVDPLADHRGLPSRVLQAVHVLRQQDDLLHRSFRLLLRLPAAGAVGAEDRALDDRLRLLLQRERERVVQHPGNGAPDVSRPAHDGGGGGPHRIGVDVDPLADSRDHQSADVRALVAVEDDRLPELALQLPRSCEPSQSARDPIVELR
jgi:hypothetical protein